MKIENYMAVVARQRADEKFIAEIYRSVLKMGQMIQREKYIEEKR